MPKSKAAVAAVEDSGSESAPEGRSKKRQLDEVCQFLNYSAVFPDTLTSQMNKSPRKPKLKQIMSHMALYARFYFSYAYLICYTEGRKQGASRQSSYDDLWREIYRPRQKETRYSAGIQGHCFSGYT